MKYIFTAAAIALALLIIPAKASDEYVSQKLSDIRKDKSNKGLILRKVTAEEEANFRKVIRLPNRVGVMWEAAAVDQHMILIVRDDVIVLSTNPMPDEVFNAFMAGKVPEAPATKAKPKGEGV